MTNATNHDHGAASPEERRALDAEELQMADQARHPALGQLTDRELSDLVSRLRDRRKRARDIADRQGREARAKAAPSGTTPASGNTGTLAKHDYLGAALERAMQERQSRTPGNAASQHDMAQKAMAQKKAGETGPSPMTEDGGPLHPDDPDANPGKGALDDTARRTAPSGALDHAGELPARERARTRY